MEKKKEKRGAMEILWICFFVLCLFFAVMGTIKHGFRDAVSMYICSLVSLLMFFWRQSLRRNEEKRQQEDENGAK